MKKYFLGLSAHFSGKDILRHTFAFGTPKDSTALKEALSSTYTVPIDHTALTKNGRSAIAIALKTLVPKNSKVLINGFTCQAVVEAVLAARCTPIYADINEKTLHYGLKEFTKVHRAHPDLKAIIIQNTLGLPADPKLYNYAKRANLVIIEDMAHFIGTDLKGDAACLSFGKGKVIDTISGGAIILKDHSVKQPERPPRFSDSFRARFYPLFGRITRALTPTIFAKLWMGGLLKLHLIERSADSRLDTNVRMSHWQAKLALRKLTNRRVTQSEGDPQNVLRSKNFGGGDCGRTRLLVKNREDLLKKLAAHRYYFSEIWYDIPISPARNYKKWHFPEQDCPTATKISRSIINIPTYYPEQDLQPALDIIKEYQDEHLR